MKVLIACEESQRVCIEFRWLGHEAYSCDIEPCSGGYSEWHIQQDVIPLLNGNVRFKTMDGKIHVIKGKWDLIIAHPPCTYLSIAGASRLYPGGVLNEERLEKGFKAKEFFLTILNADCDKICVENPTQFKIFDIPKCNQVIQPYMFGNPYSKRTCLWLKGLPKLKPTFVVDKSKVQSTKVPGNWYNKGGVERQKNRSKTFVGIATAMAEQWGYDAE